MRSEKVTFGGHGGEALAARLELPEDGPRAYALFAHCFTCSKDSLAAGRIAAALAEAGIATMRFDFTGLGASGGDFANTNFSSNVEDLVRAADFLRASRESPKVLIGHSLGGAAVLAAAARVPESVAVATIGAPSDPAHLGRMLAGAAATIEAEGEAEVTIAGRNFRIRKQFLDDIRAQRLEDRIARLGKALLVFHGPKDEVVGIENAAAIFQAARHPKSFVSLDDADHLLTSKADGLYVGAVLAAWASRYLGTNGGAADLSPGSVEAAPGEVVVAETGQGTFAQAITVGRHRLLADEPVAAGGTDTGPGPYDLLAAALGACTSMTLRLYARRNGWPLERVVVRLRHDKVHAQDCAECETKEGRIDRIERRIEITGALGEGQRGRLAEIADKCPVHRTLSAKTLIVTRLGG